MKQRNVSIDTLRLIGAFGIILAHIPYGNLPKEYISNVRLLAQWPVPFFFMIGGYFLGKTNCVPRDCLRRCLRLTWIFLFSTALYLPVQMWQSKKIFDLEFMGHHYLLIRGSYFHLWFIGSMILGYLVIAVLYEYRFDYLLYPLSVLLICFMLITHSYNLWDIPVDKAVGRHFQSIPFMFIGILISKHNKLKPGLCWAVLLFGIALQVVECHLLWKYASLDPRSHYFLLSTVVITVGILYVGINSGRIFRSPFLARLGQKYTLGIYLLHPLFIIIIFKIARMARIEDFALFNISSPLIVLIVIILFLQFCREYLPPIFSMINGNRSEPKSYPFWGKLASFFQFVRDARSTKNNLDVVERRAEAQSEEAAAANEKSVPLGFCPYCPLKN